MKKVILTVPVLLSVFASAPLAGQAVPLSDRPFDAQVLRPAGQPVIPVYDGWYQNPDGSYTMCFAYFNLNTSQSLDVPLGPANQITPAEYQGQQPTHFDPVPNPKLTQRYRHHWCVFSVQVPENFGDESVWWSLASAGDTLRVPGRLNPAYILEELHSSGREVTAPTLQFPGSPEFRGRNGYTSDPLRARVGQPLTVTVRVDQYPDDLLTWLGWTKHQGPADVKFSAEEVLMERAGESSITTTFDTPGEYVLRVQAINNPEAPKNPTGSFEFHCCWTNGYVRVNVTQ